MGIGNPTIAAVVPPVITAHYPSWGSETPASERRRRRLPALITPHGDRKLTWVVPPTTCLGDLITPHGDRKLDFGFRSPKNSRTPHYPSWGSETSSNSWRSASEHFDLITPHGDRKPRLRRQLTQPFRALITPHGDRKPVNPEPHVRSRFEPHYPSWGSETAARGPVARRRYNSLPLMGIGNTGGRFPTRWKEILLITPHGDRKPCPSVRRRGTYRRLITPHGDRKRDEPAQWRPTRSADSLPLMGIGNAAAGLQTRTGAGISLPLMGIGNLSRARSSSARSEEISLPLMGIGNARVRRQLPQLLGPLITPHGDRKLFADTPASTTVSVSLPLMGIGNPGRSRTARPPHPTLITPHGDRKHSPSACSARPS